MKYNGNSEYISFLLKYIEKKEYKGILDFLGTKGSGKSTLLLTFVQLIHERKKIGEQCILIQVILKI